METLDPRARLESLPDLCHAVDTIRKNYVAFTTTNGYFYATAGPADRDITSSDIWTACFNVLSGPSDGERDAFFETNRMTDLGALSIAFFNQTRSVDGIVFDWVIPTQRYCRRSTNYDEYLEALADFDDPSSIEAQSAAAQQTWTYRNLAAPNGFTNVGIIKELYDFGGERFPQINPRRISGLILRPGLTATPTTPRF